MKRPKCMATLFFLFFLKQMCAALCHLFFVPALFEIISPVQQPASELQETCVGLCVWARGIRDPCGLKPEMKRGWSVCSRAWMSHVNSQSPALFKTNLDLYFTAL